MEAMIDSGEEWMIPLLDYRDWLASTQDPEVKPMQRNYRSRDGRIKITKDGRLRYRTYTLEFSKEMLRRLFETQEEVQQYDPNFSLISIDELREIRRIWMTERQDWQDSLPQLYEEANDQVLDWDYEDIATPKETEAVVLQQIAQQYSVPLELVQKLLDAEWQHHGMRRRGSIHKKIEKTMREDWRTLEEVQAEAKTRRHKATTAAKNL